MEKILMTFLVLALNAYADKVFVTKLPHEAEIKVYEATQSHLADARVYVVDWPHEAIGENLWYYTKFPHEADVRIHFVEYPHEADKKVYFVKYRHAAD